MDKKKILETLFDKKIIKVLRLLINNPDKEFFLREISRSAKVSPATTHRILKTLKELELVVEKKNRYLKLYSANQKNLSMFSDLLEDKSAALREFVEFISTVKGVQQVMLHGEEERDKASIIIVGEGSNQESINSKVVELKERFNFTIIYMFLSLDQYSQMSSMGLFSGRKVILFSI
ncbi:MAG: winged helix-turn-helix domain-containing protein [Candidatus Woesearchaeota archaeon]|jgi:DNA-binding MarR family transcriptional regulator